MSKKAKQQINDEIDSLLRESFNLRQIMFYERARRKVRKAFKTAELNELIGLQCRCLLDESDLLRMMGKYAQSEKCAEKAISIADTSDQHYMKTQVRMKAGGKFYRLLKFEKTRETVYDSVVCQEEFPELAAGGLAILGHISELRGELPEALSWFRESAVRCKDAGLIGEYTYALLEIARLNTSRGDYIVALDQIEEVEDLCKKHNFHKTLAAALLRKSSIYYLIGHWRKACDLDMQARTIANKHCVSPLVDEEDILRASTLLQAGNTERALQQLESCERTFGIRGELLRLVLTRLKKIEVLLILKRYQEALESCFLVFEMMKSRYNDFVLLFCELLSDFRDALSESGRTSDGQELSELATEIEKAVKSSGWLSHQKRKRVERLVTKAIESVELMSKKAMTSFEVNGRRVDFKTRAVYIDGEGPVAKLTITELRVFRRLAMSRGLPVNHKDLAQTVRRGAVHLEKTSRRGTAHNHIASIRRKLQDDSIIKTITGVGWMIPLR